MGRVLVAHQPAYWPWCGYFSRLLDVEELVLLDHVQFAERGWQHRNSVAGRDGRPVRLIVPVRRAFGQRLVDVEIAEPDFARRHWRTLSDSYRRAPHFARYADQLEELYVRRWTRLVDLNEAVTRVILATLGLDVTVTRTSITPPAGTKTGALVDLCRRHGADVLRVGTGATVYLDADLLSEAGIRVEVATYAHAPYGCARNRPARLSVLDLLMYEGPRARAVLTAGARTSSFVFHPERHEVNA
ncbi:WbqC family protein [Streptomyces sp. H10-C2]|uniref:WbqC family protein n=1 Tax=unclassified Streptomyces TaxID=2593676 RepID=UPI0024B8FA7E|nr:MULTISPECIES: WbqC family protein [unclassified Streptomyces]MDJ0342781.1 WbqC family protein [Streptomyces sp. PH10-H1]MDJ0372459.1 WbqC family protein [Streptomyces sp. H10-C2]